MLPQSEHLCVECGIEISEPTNSQEHFCRRCQLLHYGDWAGEEEESETW